MHHPCFHPFDQNSLIMKIHKRLKQKCIDEWSFREHGRGVKRVSESCLERTMYIKVAFDHTHILN